MPSKGGPARWTDAQLADHLAKRGAKPAAAPVPAGVPKATGGMDAFYALGRIAKGRMNKTEAAYAQILDARKHDGTIRDWKFHVLRVRLAGNTFYEPDFMVFGAQGQIELHECKGSYVTDKGMLKVKLCAEVLPWFRIILCKKQKNGVWEYQEIGK